MMRIALAFVVAVAMFSTSSVALAGGFAVTTLDALPSPVAGQTYRVGFMVRQHGVTPVRDATPAILVERGSERLRFAAIADGPAGHYVANVTFPTDGEWTWSVDQAPFPMPQQLGTIRVAAPIAPLPQRPPAELALLGIVGLAGLLILPVKRVTTPATRRSTAATS
jgi:hypothetical protein